MATMNVSLPDKMKDWVENQTQLGRYSNTSDYVRDLIRRDQERNDRIAYMQTLVSEASENGSGDKPTDDDETRLRNVRALINAADDQITAGQALKFPNAGSLTCEVVKRGIERLNQKS